VTAPREYRRDPKGSSTGGQFTVQEKSAQSAPAKRRTRTTAPEPVSKPSSSRFKTLAPGEDNDTATVKEMQQLLTALGMGNLKVDGDYGSNTSAAVKAAQRRLGLKPTGKASKALVNKLLNAYDLSPCIKRSEDPDPDDLERSETADQPDEEPEDGAMFEALRAAVELDDEEAERDLAEVLAGCSPEELDEIAALAEMDGDE